MSWLVPEQGSRFGTGDLRVSFSDKELDEDKVEILELLDLGEQSLLDLSGGKEFSVCFDSIFRCFHNLKGAFGMLEMTRLQGHMHELENSLMQFKETRGIPRGHVAMFLRGIDAARSLLEKNETAFNYDIQAGDGIPEQVKPLPSAVPEAPQQNVPAANANVVAPGSMGTADFVAESDEQIESFSKQLRAIETGTYTQENLNQSYRAMHSLKGAAFLFGYNEMGSIAHALESALEPVRDGVRTMSQSLINVVYTAVQLLEMDLALIKANQPNTEVKMRSVSVIEALNLAATSFIPKTDPKAEPKTDSATAEPKAHAVEEKLDASAQNKEAEAGASIRVPVALLDNLLTLMGEMVLVRNQVLQFSSESEDLNFLNLSQRLNVVTSELQGEMMKTRMQPIGNILNKFHRVVRDLSHELGKNIALSIAGAETELDKSLLEAVKDPLTHIVRNSCDHGIESAVDRKNNGKTQGGTISIKSYHEGGQVVIEVSDDGKGLSRSMLTKKAIEKGIITEAQGAALSEKDAFKLIFAPGFSTAAKVTSVSGRGVGMDVVRTNIEKIGGTVDLSSVEGQGTTIRLKIPLTLAIVPALIVHGAQGTFAIPQVKLIELVRVDQISESKIEYLQGAPVFRLRGNILPIVDLNHVLGLGQRDCAKETIINIAVLSAESHSFGLIVDSIDDTADIVVKPLSRLLKSLSVYSGATILGDGSVALILDVQGLAKVAQLKNPHSHNVQSNAAGNGLAAIGSEQQDFLLVKVNSPTKHAIILSYVNRLEEFKQGEIELSGAQRVVRYRGSILPIISANQYLKYGPSAPDQNSDICKVVVIERVGRLFGIEVDSVLDTLSTLAETDTKLVGRPGVIGNLSTEKELVVVMDPFELISMAFPHLQTKAEGEPRKEPTVKRACKILLAEDSAFFRRLVKEALESAGHTVTTAGDGLEAIEILKQSAERFDIIVSDIEMPRLNGFKFAAAVRATKEYASIPLLALSSKAGREREEEGNRAGFDLFLEKMKPEVLTAAIQELVDLSKRKAA